MPQFQVAAVLVVLLLLMLRAVSRDYCAVVVVEEGHDGDGRVVEDDEGDGGDASWEGPRGPLLVIHYRQPLRKVPLYRTQESPESLNSVALPS